jgi:hypothetical protein
MLALLTDEHKTLSMPSHSELRAVQQAVISAHIIAISLSRVLDVAFTAAMMALQAKL